MLAGRLRAFGEQGEKREILTTGGGSGEARRQLIQ